MNSPTNQQAASDLPNDSAEGPKKDPEQILREEVHEGLEALRRSSKRLFLSALSAGLDLGFSFFLIAVVRSRVEGEFSGSATELLTALVYPLGFILVVMGRSELFTEQTTLAILPLLNGKVSWVSVMRLWGIVYVANLIGASIFAGLVVLIGPSLGVIKPIIIQDIAKGVVDHPTWTILLSATLAGWLMGLLSWLVVAGRDSISQIVVVFLITATIGLCHLHHSIVGTIEVMAALLHGGPVSLGDFLHFLVWTTLGNAFGGVFFVAVLKFGHAKESRYDGQLDSDGKLQRKKIDRRQ